MNVAALITTTNNKEQNNPFKKRSSSTHHRRLGAVLSVEGALGDEDVALRGGEQLGSLFHSVSAAAAR